MPETNLLENKLFLQYLAGAGSAISAGEPVGPALSGITQQNISAQNYMKLLKQLLAGGGKINLDKENINIKAPVSAFGGEGETSKMGVPTGGSGLDTSRYSLGTQPSSFDIGELINPSASPLDISGADLAGLTPEMISQALQLKFAGEELKRKTMADIVESTYYGAATRRMEAEAARITPSISIPGTDIKLSRPEYIQWYKAATKDERTAAIKNYQLAVSEGYEGKFEDWMMSLAKAAGGIPEFAAKRRLGKEIDIESKLAGPDFAQSVREDLMKDKSTWGFPSTYESFISKGYDEATALDLGQKTMVIEEMDSRIRSFYKGKKVERRQDGWYVGGELKVRNPYAGD